MRFDDRIPKSEWGDDLTGLKKGDRFYLEDGTELTVLAKRDEDGHLHATFTTSEGATHSIWFWPKQGLVFCHEHVRARLSLQDNAPSELTRLMEEWDG